MTKKAKTAPQPEPTLEQAEDFLTLLHASAGSRTVIDDVVVTDAELQEKIVEQEALVARLRAAGAAS